MKNLTHTVKRLVLFVRYTYLKKKDDTLLKKDKWSLLADKVKLVDEHMFIRNLVDVDLSKTLNSAFSDVGSFKNNLININQTLKGNTNVRNYIKTIGTTVAVKDFFTRDSGHYLSTPTEYISETKTLLLSIAQYCITETKDSDGVAMNNKYMLDFYFSHLHEYVELMLDVCLA